MHSDTSSSSDQEPRDRKTTKPLMEKRRRARINASLTELKSLLLEAIKKEGTRHNKMEKADILEMTVKHLRQMQREQFTAAAAEDPTVLSKYHHGFNSCAQEVKRFLSSMDSCDTDVKTRLLDHIANSLSGVGGKDTKYVPRVTSSVSLPPSPVKVEDGPQRSWSPRSEASINVDVNNNVAGVPSLEPVKSANVFSGLQVIPTQLPSGEIAFVLPTNILKTSPTPGYMIPVLTGTTQGTTMCTTPSVQTFHVDSGVSATVHTDLPKSCVISSGTDKSYLPCATVTPVKAVSQQSNNLTNSYVIEKSNFANGTSCLRADSGHPHEDMVWRPW